jgi:hypothetical protein
MKASYVRLFADDQGESHFQDVHAELDQVNFAHGIPPLFVSGRPFTGAFISFYCFPIGAMVVLLWLSHRRLESKQ